MTFTLFANHHVVIRTPTGIEYRGTLRLMPSLRAPDEHGYVGDVTAVASLTLPLSTVVMADQHLVVHRRTAGTRPQYFDPRSRAEPLQVRLNRLPPASRKPKTADSFIGELWTHEGLWSIWANPVSASGDIVLTGTIRPSRQEHSNPDSLIAGLRSSAAGKLTTAPQLRPRYRPRARRRRNQPRP